MKRLIVLLALAALLVAGGYYYVQQHPEALPQAGQLKQFEQLKQQVQDASPLTKFLSRVAPIKPKAGTTPAPPPMTNPVTLYLVNGGIVTGDLVSETRQAVTLHFDYGDVGFQRAEIKRFVKGKEGTGDDSLTIPWENVIPQPKPNAPPDSSEDR
jgi:hypothetical protein